MAQGRYVILAADQPPPEGAELLTTRQGLNVWRQPDALPYAFSVADPAGPINRQTVTEQPARLDGPNRVIVQDATGQAGDQLVVLVSDYPGWRVWVDGQPAALRPLNGYLGVEMAAGAHTYVFEFRPAVAYVGMAISGLTLLLCLGLIVYDWRKRNHPQISQIEEESAKSA
jgi:hypothetical protein